MKRLIASTLLAASVGLGGTVATNAATVDIQLQQFSNGDIAGAQAAYDAFIGGAQVRAYEDFESYSEFSNPIQTNIGAITRLLPQDPGGSVSPECRTAKLCIRSGNVFGRYNTSGGAGDDQWLDSNDLEGMSITMPGNSGLSDFNRVAFMLTDVDDVRDFQFSISARSYGDLTSIVTVLNEAPVNRNGNIQLVTMAFSDFVTDVRINLRSGAGDGFGLDNFTAAAVPLPAAAWMLLAGVGGLFAMRRRKTA